MSAPVNAQLAGTVLAQAMALPTDRARALYYRQLAERAMRDYSQGRAESMNAQVDVMRASRRHALTSGDIAEAQAVGKRRWSEHAVAQALAADETLYTRRSVFYAAMAAL